MCWVLVVFHLKKIPLMNLGLEYLDISIFEHILLDKSLLKHVETVNDRN